MTFKINHFFNSKNNRHFLNGMCAVLHCHHYATLTTQLAMDAKHFNGENKLYETAEECFHRALNRYFQEHAVREANDKIAVAKDYWRIIGMGLVDFSYRNSVLAAKMDYSHIDEGWLKKWGKSDKPVNIITSGFIAAVASLVNDKPLGWYRVFETKSLVMGDEVSEFVVEEEKTPRILTKVNRINRSIPDNLSLTLSLQTNIDRLKVIDQLSKITVTGNEHGLIPAFNVFVQQLPAEFWAGFAMRLINDIPEEMIETAEYLLKNCASECGYHTGYGIITSDVWNEVVAPMVKKIPEDILHGAFSVFTAWGWAMCEVVELIPGNKMILRAYDYYESDVETDRYSAHMIQGVASAFMDLAYGGNYDPTGKTGFGTYTCEQTKGIEKGDLFGEFIITKA